MNIAGMAKTTAITLGGTVAVAGTLGAITALNSKPNLENRGFPQHEKRDTMRNSLIGLLGGGAIGLAVASRMPLAPAGYLLGLGIGAGVGAAAAGAFTLGHSLAN